MRRMFMFFLFPLLTSTVAAQQEGGTIAGAGWVSCGEYAARYQRDPRATEDYFYAWAQGYMSGVNDASLFRKNLRGLSIIKQKEHIRLFCDQRPLANVVVAVRDLFDRLPLR